MSKSVDEIAAEIVAASLASGELKTTGTGASYQAGEIASAFKIIRDAVASLPSPGP